MRLRNKIFAGVGAAFALGLAGLAITLSYETACHAPPPLAAGTESMRAITRRCYGSPRETLTVERVRKSAPERGHLLIKVHAVSVNPYEWHMTTGKPYL